jgi:hypothetical protein
MRKVQERNGVLGLLLGRLQFLKLFQSSSGGLEKDFAI